MFFNKISKEPVYYHHEFENDFPKEDEVGNRISGQCIRITQAALPFFSLYKPLNQSLSIVLGATRVVSSLSKMVEAIGSKDTNAIGKSVLEVSIVSTALCCSILAHPLGMVTTTAHDMMTNVIQLIEALQNKDYQKAADVGLHLTNNALYFGCFLAGSLEWSIASIGFQIFLGLYSSCEEFKKGNYLESCSHLIMSGMRGKQIYEQIQVIQHQRKVENILQRI